VHNLFTENPDFMQNLLRSSWIVLLILVGVFYFLVLLAVARRIGGRAASEQLLRWLQLPAVILNFFEATSVDAALIGLMDSLSEIFQAEGSILFMKVADQPEDAEAVLMHMLAAEGTLRRPPGTGSESLRLLAHDYQKLLHQKSGKAFFRYITAAELHGDLQDWLQAAGIHSLLALGFEVHFTAGHAQESGVLLVFDSGVEAPDPMRIELLDSTAHLLPRILEKMTVRFAQAEELEAQLQISRTRDMLLKQLLSGFQHDVGHALANLEQGVLETCALLERRVKVLAEPRPESTLELVEALRQSVRLVSQVAASGTVLVEVAEGSTVLTAVESCEPGSLLLETVQPLLSLHRRTRPELVVHLEIEPDLPVVAVDRVAFFRIVSNVLHNAYKFTAEGGIKILLSAAGGWVTLAVSDTGCGIPAVEIEQLGRIHHRGSNASGFPGSGLGLWTARMLLEEMGGKLAIHSEAGAGSTFVLHFPASRPGQTRSDPVVHGRRDATYD